MKRLGIPQTRPKRFIILKDLHNLTSVTQKCTLSAPKSIQICIFREKKMHSNFVSKLLCRVVSPPTLYYHYGYVKPEIGRLYQNVGHFVVKRWSGIGVVSTIILTPYLRKPLSRRASGVVCQSVGGNPQKCHSDFGLFPIRSDPSLRTTSRTVPSHAP